MCRDKEDLPPAPLVTAHVVSWFVDLNSARDFLVIAGMAGGGFIPRAIGYEQILAWADLVGNRPTPWEIHALRAMDLSWRAAYDKKGSKGNRPGASVRRHQAIGDYCKGENIEECGKQFGGGLEHVCATCPN